MKLLVLLAALIALCAGSAIPLLPGDNSHYVEGESRYIWMPDGDGTPHLVDLQEPVNEQLLPVDGVIRRENEYWLYTRQNPTIPQIIITNPEVILSSNYVASRELKVIVHGWYSNGNSEVNNMLRDAFLAVSDCNVIVVDWRVNANSNYTTTVNTVPHVGSSLGYFLLFLYNVIGFYWNKVHMVGFGLGAHVVGRACHWNGVDPERVTGLDPAGPLWEGNSNALNANHGTYVECIHTDGVGLGIFNPIGDADFYPNGGRHAQPGCWISTCSHSRAYQLFAATIRYNHLIGRQCTNLSQAQNNQCSGNALQMGNALLTKRGNGLFGLSTGDNWPY